MRQVDYIVQANIVTHDNDRIPADNITRVQQRRRVGISFQVY